MGVRTRFGSIVPALAALALGPTVLSAQQPAGKPGILVMAHGGAPEWDRAVAAAVEPVKARIPTALAMGMADPTTLQAALDSLRGQGVETVAVVRLFLSGESFLHDTEFYLGLREDAPAVTMMMMMQGHGGHGGGHGAHETGPPRRLDLPGPVLMEMRGLSDMPLTAGIVADRARGASRDPAGESVIVVAHGMGDEGENQRVLDNMRASVEALRAAGFREAHAATLREDWPDARAQAQEEIRAWVASRAERGDRVIVVPFRVFGFGGYAEVLEGLDYVPTEGLLPHALVSRWIEESAGSLFCAEGVANPLSDCTVSF